MCEDFNYEKSTSHINDWIKRRQLGIGGRPYTCERANSAGVGCDSPFAQGGKAVPCKYCGGVVVIVYREARDESLRDSDNNRGIN